MPQPYNVTILAVDKSGQRAVFDELQMIARHAVTFERNPDPDATFQYVAWLDLCGAAVWG